MEILLKNKIDSMKDFLENLIHNNKNIKRRYKQNDILIIII